MFFFFIYFNVVDRVLEINQIFVVFVFLKAFNDTFHDPFEIFYIINLLKANFLLIDLS